MIVAYMCGTQEPNDQELMWIAREGIDAPLPTHWKPVQQVREGSAGILLLMP